MGFSILGIFKKKGSSGSSVPDLKDQLMYDSGQVNLGASTVPLTPNVFSPYGKRNLKGMKITFTVTETTGTSVPTGWMPIETALKKFQLSSGKGSGSVLFNMDGTKNDLSIWARYLTFQGKYTPSTTPSGQAASTTYTYVWNLVIPYGINFSDFDLRPEFELNTLASLTTGANALASGTARLQVYGTFTKEAVPTAILKAAQVSNLGSGTANLGYNYDKGVVIQSQFLQYGADADINTIYFAANGETPELPNISLQSLIDREDTVYPVSGHVAGIVNLFTDAFNASGVTALNIDFASAPSLLNGTSGILREYWIEPRS